MPVGSEGAGPLADGLYASARVDNTVVSMGDDRNSLEMTSGRGFLRFGIPLRAEAMQQLCLTVGREQKIG